MKLAKENGRTYASYNWDGAFYEQLRKGHDVSIHKLVWNRVQVGDVSLKHEADFTPARKWGGG
jgi:hypothetical protein